MSFGRPATIIMSSDTTSTLTGQGAGGLVPGDPETWPAWISRHLCNATCIPAQDAASRAWEYAKENKIAAALAFATSLPGGVNAFCMLLNIKPEQLHEKIGEISPGMLSACTLFAVISVYVNTLMNAYFLPKALDGLKENLQKICTATGLPLNLVYMIAGVSAFLAAGAISYGAFSAIPGVAGELLGPLFGLLNALITFCSRYTSLPGLIKRITDLFDQDVQLKHDAISKLKYLKDEYLSELMGALNQSGLTDDDGAIEELLKKIDEITKGDPNATHKKPQDYIKEYAGTLFDLALATAAAFYIFPLMANSGFSGVNIIAQGKLEKLSQVVKEIIGGLPGFVSAIFYFNHVFDFRRISLSTLDRLKEHPNEIPSALLSLILSGVSGSLLGNVSRNMVTGTNIFGITPGPFGLSVEVADFLFPSLVNSKVLQKNAADAHAREVKEQRLEDNKQKQPEGTTEINECTIQSKQDAIDYLIRHRLSKEVTDNLRHLSIFGGNGLRQRQTTPPTAPLNDAESSPLLAGSAPQAIPHTHSVMDRSTTDPDFVAPPTFQGGGSPSHSARHPR